MRINDIGGTSPSIAKFNKLTRTAKHVRESKAISEEEFTTEVDMDEATDQYSASNSRRLLVQLDNMLSSMQKIVAEIYGTDNGDLQDQITVMDKYLKGFNSVIARAMKVVPTTEDAGDEDFRDGHDIELLKKVSAQIAQDVANNDYTAIDDLLKNVSTAEMQGFLSEMESVNEKSKGLWANIHAKRARGEKPAKPGEKGYPKTLDIKEDADVKAQYDELTDENHHGEAALLLAKTYGTELEAKLIQAIMDVHHARGNIMPEEQKLRDSIANKYYKQMMSDTFPANTSATQGKRMGEGKFDSWIKQYPDDVNDSGTGGPGATRRINMMKKNDLYDKDHGVKKRTVKTKAGKGPSSGPAVAKVTGPIKPIKRPNVPKSGWAQVLDFGDKNPKARNPKPVTEVKTNMFGIQVREIDDKIKDIMDQIDLASRNQGGWKQSDIPKLESKLAHLKMKKSKGITQEAEKNTFDESVPGMEADEYHCKDCNDTMHNPTTDCPHDSHDEQGRHWVDNNGNGIHDADEGMEKKICCKHCGDELYGEPKTDCAYDINNPNQDNWILVDIDGDGDPDMKIAMGSMPEGWMDDAKDAVGSTLGKVTDKVAGDFKKRKKLFGKAKK